MFSELIKKLESEQIEYETIDENNELTICFGMILCNDTIPCEFTYNKDEGIIRFYTEIIEFEDEAYNDGVGLANSINYNSLFVKAYLDDDNVLCAEYYYDAKLGLSQELIDDILGDIGNQEELIEQYI